MPGKRANETERREQILQAALELSLEDGLNNITSRKVASKANLSNGLVFHYYPTTDALLFELLQYLIFRLDGPRPAPSTTTSTSETNRTHMHKVLLEELQLNIDDNILIGVLLEFIVLSHKHPHFKKPIIEFIEYASKYFDEAYSADTLEGISYPISVEDLTHVSLSLIVGHSVLRILGSDNKSALEAIATYLFQKKDTQ